MQSNWSETSPTVRVSAVKIDDEKAYRIILRSSWIPRNTHSESSAFEACDSDGREHALRGQRLLFPLYPSHRRPSLPTRESGILRLRRRTLQILLQRLIVLEYYTIVEDSSGWSDECGA